MFPRKMYRIVFSFLMSFCMSLIMSGVMILTSFGINVYSLEIWLLNAFPKAWAVAFLVVLVIVPYVAKVAESLMKK